MIGRFFFGALTGVVLVASGMVLASAMFPPQRVMTVAEANPEPVAPVVDPEPEETANVAAEPVTGTPDPAQEAETVAEAEPPATVAEELAQPEVAETAPDLPAAPAEDVAAKTPTVAEVTAPKAPDAPEALESPVKDAAVDVAEPPADEGLAAAEPEPAPQTEIEVATETEVATAPEVTPMPTETLPEEVLPEPAPVEPESLPEPLPEDAAKDAGEDATGSTFLPEPGFTAEGAITERAPGTDLAEGEAAVAVTALQLYKATFDNPDAKPVLAIVLIDTGEASLDRAGLAALPFPVSFALDPMDPETPAHAAIYRAAGREVIMLATGIAEGAQASDVEVAFQAMGQNLPEAVAVMDLATPVFQNDRPLASLVVPVVGGEGRGLLTWEKGLNAADQVARRDDVAAAVIFRDLAMGGGDAAAAQRTLDRAVFKAGQDGYAVVAGEVTPTLVTALLEWSIEGRAGEVALGPLTAVLKVD